MVPIVNGLNDEFDGRVSVVQLDAAQSTNAKLQTEYGLRGHPAFAVLDSEGRVTQLLFGPQTERVLRQSMVAVAGN
jgi:hypothetical protein